MKFNSQICTTKEQSERLLALGLKKETADCFWLSNTSSITGKTHCRIIVGEFEEDNRCVPAWSFHRLLELCNVFYIGHKDYDSLINYLENLIKEDCFNKDYLEE